LDLPGERIIYNGPNKTRESLETAVQEGVKLINIDSLTDLHNTVAASRAQQRRANIGVRLCPTHGWSAQFGLNMHNGEAAEGIRIIGENGDCLDFKAIHVHLGSLITDKSLFQKTIAEIVSFIDANEAIREKLQYLDMGGGYGVPMVREIGGIERRLSGMMGRPFAPPNPEKCPSIEQFGQTMRDALDRHAGSFPNGRPTVIVEPGRALTSNTQTLLLGVRAMKERTPPVAILDGGKMNITFPTSFEYHHVLVANKMRQKAAGRYNLVGRTCTPSDVVYHNQTLPELAVGDLVAIMDAGAYFTSFSNDFAFPRPPIVLAHDGSTTMLRERETFEGMVARDVFD
jgi:diaminopimelate decarboxylase